MANKTGVQPDVEFCPKCKGDLRNVPRSEMKSKGYIRKDGSTSEYAIYAEHALRLTKIAEIFCVCEFRIMFKSGIFTVDITFS